MYRYRIVHPLTTPVLAIAAGLLGAPYAYPQTPPGPQPRQAQPGKQAGQGTAENQSPADKKTVKKTVKAAGSRTRVPWNDAIQAVASKKHPQGIEDLRLIQNQVRKVVDYARPATVGVQVGGAVGSAVIVSPDGLVLTAGHVAMEPNKRVVFLFPDGSRARGITLGVNRSVDSGMMKITDKGPWPFVPMAPAGDTKPGDWLVGLGQPNGFFEDRAPPVRLGRMLFGDKDTLCTDVTLVGGDSGGPLFNLKGQVVGIHSRIGRRIVSNYHIPIDQYHMTWDRLAGGQLWGGRLGDFEPARHRPWLGIAGNSTRDRCEITQVYPNTPAAKAGLQVGDVITRFGADEVTSFDQLARLILASKAGSEVRLELDRSGKTVQKKVRLSVISLGFPGSPPQEAES